MVWVYEMPNEDVFLKTNKKWNQINTLLFFILLALIVQCLFGKNLSDILYAFGKYKQTLPDISYVILSNENAVFL